MELFHGLTRRLGLRSRCWDRVPPPGRATRPVPLRGEEPPPVIGPARQGHLSRALSVRNLAVGGPGGSAGIRMKATSRCTGPRDMVDQGAPHRGHELQVAPLEWPPGRLKHPIRYTTDGARRAHTGPGGGSRTSSCMVPWEHVGHEGGWNNLSHIHYIHFDRVPI